MSDFIIDLDHIEKGVRDWQKFVDSIEDAVDDGLEELYEKTDAHINQEASKYHLDQSNLHKTKTISRIGNEFEIEYTAPHAPYVEYGTGIVGKNSPHPDPMEWEEFEGYDINDHGYDGWLYYDNKYKLRWTSGQPARPAMYNTKLWINTQATRVIRKHIRKKIERATRG
jgi:hypothetical protein